MKMPPRSAVITNPFRKEIEEMIIEGKSSRYISEWLKDQGESISHTAINNYRKNEYNIKEEAIKEYNEEQSKQRKDKGKRKIISTLELCQKFKDEAHRRNLSGIDDLDMCKIGISAGRLEHDITKDEPTSIMIVKVEDVDAEEQQLIAQLADDISRQKEDPESPEREQQDES